MGIRSYESLTPEEKASFDKVFAEYDAKEKAWFASWKVSDEAKSEALAAYQTFLTRETLINPSNFYKAPLARKAFMIGWILSRETM